MGFAEVRVLIENVSRNPREDLRGRVAHIEPPAGFEISNDEVYVVEILRNLKKVTRNPREVSGFEIRNDDV